MRRILLAVPLLGLVACTRYEGPLETYRDNRRGDRVADPAYTLDEQEKRGRSRLAFVPDDPKVLPPTQSATPGGVGR